MNNVYEVLADEYWERKGALLLDNVHNNYSVDRKFHILDPGIVYVLSSLAFLAEAFPRSNSRTYVLWPGLSLQTEVAVETKETNTPENNRLTTERGKNLYA
jgi:hypothetical protein